MGGWRTENGARLTETCLFWSLFSERCQSTFRFFRQIWLPPRKRHYAPSSSPRIRPPKQHPLNCLLSFSTGPFQISLSASVSLSEFCVQNCFKRAANLWLQLVLTHGLSLLTKRRCFREQRLAEIVPPRFQRINVIWAV